MREEKGGDKKQTVSSVGGCLLCLIPSLVWESPAQWHRSHYPGRCAWHPAAFRTPCSRWAPPGRWKQAPPSPGKVWPRSAGPGGWCTAFSSPLTALLLQGRGSELGGQGLVRPSVRMWLAINRKFLQRGAASVETCEMRSLRDTEHSLY